MTKLSGIEPKEVFEYFEKICSIPHGSGNMERISKFCLDFAEENGLKAIRDDGKNVIIYKDGTEGYEDAEPIILQGHIDMVCQKTPGSMIDFEKDGIEAFEEEGFLRARGTTLGADNGIAVAMIMAILARRDLSHPPIEAVLTTDEEIGMLGASALDETVLKGTRMINLDAEEEEYVTVSCAGGSDFKIFLPFQREKVTGTRMEIELEGLLGGHSGVEIDKGRVNANILMGRMLRYLHNNTDLDIISVNGGDKMNAIPRYSSGEVIVRDAEKAEELLRSYFKIIKEEIQSREPGCELKVTRCEKGEFHSLCKDAANKLVYMLLTTPDGILEMSRDIDGLVETSLNLGVLETGEDKIFMQYALRSNKASALDFLEDKLSVFAEYNGCNAEISGRYQPWEYKEASALRDLYIETYQKKYGKAPHISAIHAGLECAVFSDKIKNLDCIAIGPDMMGVHTTEEKLSISSVKSVYDCLCDTLKYCK